MRHIWKVEEKHCSQGPGWFPGTPRLGDSSFVPEVKTNILPNPMIFDRNNFSESCPCQIRPGPLKAPPRVHDCPLPLGFRCHGGRRPRQCRPHSGNQVHCLCNFSSILVIDYHPQPVGDWIFAVDIDQLWSSL